MNNEYLVLVMPTHHGRSIVAPEADALGDPDPRSMLPSYVFILVAHETSILPHTSYEFWTITPLCLMVMLPLNLIGEYDP